MLLKSKNLTPIELKAKEGLALINGTQFISSIGVKALIKAEHVLKSAVAIAALSHEALLGTTAASHSVRKI